MRYLSHGGIDGFLFSGVSGRRKVCERSEYNIHNSPERDESVIKKFANRGKMYKEECFLKNIL